MPKRKKRYSNKGGTSERNREPKKKRVEMAKKSNLITSTSHEKKKSKRTGKKQHTHIHRERERLRSMYRNTKTRTMKKQKESGVVQGLERGQRQRAQKEKVGVKE